MGDIDQFELRGAPGGEFSIAFRTLADSSTMMLRLDSAAADNGFPPQIDGVPGDSLFDRSTGRFQLPASGVTSLTVYSVDAVHGRGRYQIAAFPVDHRPERAAPTIAIGDSITNEAIDFPGDVDEYQFQTAANDTVFLTLAIDSAAAARLTGLNLILQSLSEVSNKKTPSPQAPGPGVTVGPLVLNPGTHTVSFYAQFDRTKGYVGPYRFSLSRHP